MSVESTRDTVLIVSSDGDEHTFPVIDALQDAGITVHVLLSHWIPTEIKLSLGLSDAQSLSAHIETPFGYVIDTARVRSVWWRKPTRYHGIPLDLEEQEREFIKAEVDQALAGLWAAMPPSEVRWVSPPERIESAEGKVKQLSDARALGLKVPRTLVSTDPVAVRRFWEYLEGRMIFKVFSDPFLGAAELAHRYGGEGPTELRRTMTTRITEEMLVDLDKLQACPGLFQEEIPKRAEYRVTVIGGKVFPARIDSQALPGTQLDWRAWEDGGFEVDYAVAELPPAVERACLALVEQYGLSFSAIDLIETPDGEWVFVESNPNGQFGFVHSRVPELGMFEAMTELLAAGVVAP